MSKFRLQESFIRRYKSLTPPWGFGVLSELVYYRTYSRIKPDGSNEQWWETVRRVVEGCYEMQRQWIADHKLGWNEDRAQKSAREMYDRMFNMKFLPPGRGLWAMGSPIVEERGLYAALNNCAFVSTRDDSDPSRPYRFLMDMSMLGVGVGFDTNGSGLKVSRERGLGTEIYTIPDTREGWVESVGKLLDSYLEPYAHQVEFDYSRIREAGLPIKGFGGVSSGPDPLIKLHERLTNLLESYCGRTTDARFVVDVMNMIGACVVAGNVRRTAEIALGDYIDNQFMDLKNYQLNPERMEYGWTSNNSIYANMGMNYSEVAKRTNINGEPGYFWLKNARDYGRMGREPDYKDAQAVGTNPCSEQTLESYELCCVTGDTRIQTRHGAPFIKDVVGRDVEVWNGDGWSVVRPFVASYNKEVYRVTLSDGSVLDVTGDHEWSVRGRTKRVFRKKTTSELVAGDVLPEFSLGEVGGVREGCAYEYGLLCGDGYIDNGRPMLSLHGGKTSLAGGISGKLYKAQHPTGYKKPFQRVSLSGVVDPCLAGKLRENSGLPPEIYGWDRESIMGFVAGWIDTDGSIVRNTGSEGYCIHGGEMKMRDLQLLLRRIGVDHASVYEMKGQKDETLINGVSTRRNKKMWVCQIPSFECGEIPTRLKKVSLVANRFAINNAYNDGSKIDRARKQKVVSVEHLGQEAVYCFDEPIRHMGVFGNALTYQCLVETFPHKHDTIEDYKETLKYAYLYAKTVTLGPTHWEQTNNVMSRNRRIGCSMTGVAQFIASRSLSQLRNWCRLGYDEVQRLDKKYSDWFCVPRSIKTTSVKPSGTVSLLAGATPGIHYPESRFYIRRMRLSIHSPLIGPLKDAGYKVEPCVGSEDSTVVVEIPVAVKENIRTAAEVSMWEQLELTAFMQEHWADNQVSVTVTFDPETEGRQIESALDFYQYRLKSVSFLPRIDYGAYPQMPYEAIEERKFHQIVGGLKPVALRISGEEAAPEVYCDSDGCVVL